ncbi:MAG: endonuclease III [Candidatus Zixiibacteriota bacterium]
MPRESLESKKSRADRIIALLRKRYPDAKCALNFESVHQLMVATILSAQCTDVRVNIVTKGLFKKYRSVKDFAVANINELEDDVRSTGFFRNKAKSIKHSAQQLLEDYHGEIPRTIDQLTKLAGVGRKTASVILGTGYGLAEGVVVDTHVARISRLLGLTNKTDAVKIELKLMEIIPIKDWIEYSHLLIHHGRAICIARRPKCPACPVNKLCPSAKL